MLLGEGLLEGGDSDGCSAGGAASEGPGAMGAVQAEAVGMDCAWAAWAGGAPMSSNHQRQSLPSGIVTSDAAEVCEIH